MSKATAKNVIQVVLHKCLDIRKTMKGARAVNAVMQAESNSTEMTMGIETIFVEGSDSKIYFELLKHRPVNAWEKRFKKNLRKAIKAKIQSFKVPVCNPSISTNGKLQFVPGCKVAAVGYSYNELEKLSQENGVRLGTKNEYFLFLGTIINRLMAEGWSETEAFEAVCTESTSRKKIVGKYNLTNAYKILAKDEKAGGFWIVDGLCEGSCYDRPVADFTLINDYDFHCPYSVGWFVF